MCDEKKDQCVEDDDRHEVIPPDDRSTMEVDDKLIGDDRIIPLPFNEPNKDKHPGKDSVY